jgi:hypothetical protein
MTEHDGYARIKRLRRGQIAALARHIGVADTADLDRFLIAWLWNGTAYARQDPVGAVIEAARRMGKPDLTEGDAEQIIAEARQLKPIHGTDKLGRYLRLSDATRSSIGITTIGGYDVPKRQRTLRRKQKAKERQARLRRKRGAQPHSESLSRTKPWEAEGISRTVWYERRQKAAPGQIRNAVQA